MESVVKIIFNTPLVFHLQKNIIWEFYLFIFSFLTVERPKQGGPDNICRKLDSKLRQSEGKLIINLHQSNTCCHRSFLGLLEMPHPSDLFLWPSFFSASNQPYFFKFDAKKL